MVTTGSGLFGPPEMGGMFNVVKVREGLAKNDYKNPGWYQLRPPQAQWPTSGLGRRLLLHASPRDLPKRAAKGPSPEREVRVRKPAGGHGNH